MIICCQENHVVEIYYVVADNPIGESSYEPEHGTWKVNKSLATDRVVIKGEEIDWFAVEE